MAALTRLDSTTDDQATATGYEVPSGQLGSRKCRKLRHLPEDERSHVRTHGLSTPLPDPDHTVTAFYANLSLPSLLDSVPRLTIMDQERTSRCWIFAGLHYVTLVAFSRFPGLQLSPTHISFVDTLDKARFLINSLASPKYAQLAPGDRRLTDLFRCLNEGGSSQRFMTLVKLYGVVPYREMPPVHASKNSYCYREKLISIVSALGIQIHQASHRLHTDASLMDTERERLTVEIEHLKQEAIENTRHVLSTCLGSPPDTFIFKAVCQKEVQTTPLDFLRRIGDGVPETTFICDLPHKPIPVDSKRLIRLVNDPAFRAVQLSMPKIMRVLRDTIHVHKHPVPISVFNYGLHETHRLYSRHHEGVVESSLGIDSVTSKAMTVTYRLKDKHRHAMVLVAMDPEDCRRPAVPEIPEEHTGPLGQVVNSWSPDKQHLRFTQPWLEDNFYGALMPIEYLPPDIQEFLKAPPPGEILELDSEDPLLGS